MPLSCARSICVLVSACFFFSSRRRHTRFSRDWSSDVCSSDLADFAYTKVTSIRGRFVQRPREIVRQISYNCKLQRSESAQIGRASCREREESRGGGGGSKKKIQRRDVAYKANRSESTSAVIRE